LDVVDSQAGLEFTGCLKPCKRFTRIRPPDYLHVNPIYIVTSSPAADWPRGGPTMPRSGPRTPQANFLKIKAIGTEAPSAKIEDRVLRPLLFSKKHALFYQILNFEIMQLLPTWASKK
jgi:hypothetical protein